MMIRILLTLLISLASHLALGADCQKTGEVCTDATACKLIGGVNVCLQGITPPSGGINVAASCWNYQSTYKCLEPNGVNYCAGLEALVPMCNKTSSVCNQTDTSFGTGCMLYQDTYRCSNSAMSTPANTVKLTDTYTLTYDGIDRAACASIDSNTSCTITAHTCVDGPSTKNINGLDVYKDCWSWNDSYSCVVSSPKDFCMPLKQSGCTVQSSECTATAFTGDCMEKKYNYLCSESVTPVPTDVVLLDTTYTIIKDGINYQQCDAFGNDPNCTLASETCIEGAETRNINGLDVYKDCWKWERKYTCASTVLTSTCDELKNNPLCTETGSNCVDLLPGGQCGLLEHQYQCATTTATTSTQTDCNSQTFCLDGACFDSGYPPDTDFGRVIASMEAVREATEYGLFNGEGARCSRNLLINCCKSQSGGIGGRNDKIADAVGAAAFKAGAEVIKVYGSKYLYEGLYNTGSELLQEYAMSAITTGAAMGEFSVWGATFSVSVSDGLSIAFTGFDPWSLAFSVGMYILMDLMSCEEEEQVFAIKRGQGLCHKVGSWCSTKVLGACLVKKEGWCCFPSKLGRIINEQGRPQIGKSWGDEKSPDCNGFTVDELAKLRFDLMNFSEFIASIDLPSKSSSYAVDRLTTKAQSYYAP